MITRMLSFVGVAAAAALMESAPTQRTPQTFRLTPMEIGSNRDAGVELTCVKTAPMPVDSTRSRDPVDVAGLDPAHLSPMPVIRLHPCYPGDELRKLIPKP